MDKAELRETLKELGWSQTKLADKLNINPVTVRRWKEVPGPAAAYIRLVVSLKRFSDEAMA